MLPEWNIIEGENTPRGCLASPSSEMETSTVAALGPNSNLGSVKSVLQTDFEQTASLIPAGNDRQRTAQACDKCRERKTKCSGDHPVCHRCTARGLICQYSSREPRARGPSKARLRNAISSIELHTQHSINTERQGFQHTPPVLPSKQIQDYSSQEYAENGPKAFPHQRVASFSRPQHDPLHYLPSGTIINAAVYDSHDPPPLSYDNHSYTSPHTTPPVQAPPPQFINKYIRPHYREVRRVQSHSILIGGGKDHHYNMHRSMLSQGDHGGPASHRCMPAALPPMLGPFDGSSSRSQFDHQGQRPADLHPWVYHSDGGSSGSEPRSIDESIAYSPSSSEEVPEPKPVDIATSGPFDLSQMHNCSLPHFTNHLNGNTYPIGPQASYSDPSSAMLDLNHHHIEVANMDIDHGIHPGHNLIYPSPITPIGVSMLQEEIKPKPNQQELYDYLHGAAEETGVHPFNQIGISRTTLR